MRGHSERKKKTFLHLIPTKFCEGSFFWPLKEDPETSQHVTGTASQFLARFCRFTVKFGQFVPLLKSISKQSDAIVIVQLAKLARPPSSADIGDVITTANNCVVF